MPTRDRRAVPILPPPSAEEVAALRAQRRAAEATRLAAEAAAEARLAEHARVLAEVRQHLDLERRAQAERQAARGQRARRREELDSEIARLTAERAALDLVDEDETATDTAKRAEEEAAERARHAEERRALAEQMLRELDEIDRRLEERAAAAQSQPRRPAGVALGAVAVRRKARFEVQASVLLDHEGAVAALPLRNISLTGALISAPEGAPRVRVGALLFITLYPTSDPTRQVDVNARVVRSDAHGIAVDWSDEHDTTHAVAVLLEELLDQ